MLRLLFHRKAQSTAEYAILIGLIIAVVMGMQTYIKRGLQARTHDATDDFYSSVTGGNWTGMGSDNATTIDNKQYEIDLIASQMTQDVSDEARSSNMAKDGTLTRTYNQTTSQAEGDYQHYKYNTTD